MGTYKLIKLKLNKQSNLSEFKKSNLDQMRIEAFKDFFNVSTELFLKEKEKEKAKFTLFIKRFKGNLMAQTTDKTKSFSFKTSKFIDLKRLNTLTGILMTITSDKEIKYKNLSNTEKKI